MRVDLAAAYRLVALYGWDDLIFTHLSARVPGPEHHFLIDLYNLMFEEITASSLVKIDGEGRPAAPTPYIVNAAGSAIHSAIHMARDDAQAVEAGLELTSAALSQGLWDEQLVIHATPDGRRTASSTCCVIPPTS